MEFMFEKIGEFIGIGLGSLVNPIPWVVAIWLVVKNRPLQSILIWSILTNSICSVFIIKISILHIGGPNVSIILVFLATGFAGGIVGLGSYLFILIFKKPTPSNQEATSKNNENTSISSESVDENREPVKENQELKIESISPDSPLLFLAIFQQEGRLIDFLKEDISTYSDAEIGAAARIVHTGCKRAISEYLSIQPISAEIEGTKITLPTNFDTKLFWVHGDVASPSPFTGTLMHRGWLVSSINIPQMTNQHKSRYLLAPMEIEL